MAEGVQRDGKEMEDDKCTEDHSIVCRPIYTGVSGIQMVLNSVKNGTAEIRDLLLNECDLIYECKICRSLHRSLVNFIAHKRSYCLQHCCESMQLFSETIIENEETITVIPRSPLSEPEPQPQQQTEMMETNDDVVNKTNSDVKTDMKAEETERKEEEDVKETKQLEVHKSTPKIFNHHDRKNRRWHRVGIVNGNSDRSTTNSHAPKFYNDCIAHLEHRKSVRVERRLQVKEIETNPNAVYQSVIVDPSTSSKVGHPIVAPPLPTPSNALFNKNPFKSDKKSICIKCGKRFKSIRKMVVHVQNVHSAKRTYFPCPYCKTLFVQIWSLFRHLMRVHNKSKQQVDRMREKLKSKVIEQSVENENKTNDDNQHVPAVEISKPVETFKPMLKTVPVVSLENSIVHQCNICSKVFLQKPSLDGHRSSCLTKQRAIAASLLKESGEENGGERQAAIEFEDTSRDNCRSDRPRRVGKKKMLHEDFVNSSYINIRTNSVNPPKKVEPQTQTAEVVIASSGIAPPDILLKLNAIIDCRKKQCLKCKQTFVTLSNARRHAAGHIGYNRFRCQKCNFQAYGRSQIRCHILKVHVDEKTGGKMKDRCIDRLIVSIEKQPQQLDQQQVDVSSENEAQVKVEPENESHSETELISESNSHVTTHSVLQSKTEIKTQPISPCTQLNEETEEEDSNLAEMDNAEEPALREETPIDCHTTDRIVDHVIKKEMEETVTIYVQELEDDSPNEPYCDTVTNHWVQEDHNYFSSATSNGYCAQIEQDELLEAVGSII